MKRIQIIIALVFLSSLMAVAQTSLREGRIISGQSSKPKAKNHVKTSTSQVSSAARSAKNGNKVISNDTIYCSQTKKQHGWFAPMDTLSKEMASHQRHFRFTKKNNAGHWLRLESMDAYGNHFKGSLSPYILKLGSAVESDKNANSDWVEKLKTACIWEFIADYTGETIIQERAYDENMNIVFTFSRVPIGNGQYNCSYKDCYGLPAEMRNDEDYTYGTLVRITEDRWGNDSVMQYIDAKGLPKLNSDSVAMEVYICDKHGHLLKQQSRNMDGSLAIDNWGNCGIEYEWNNTHDIVSATYMDDSWKPMRMPAKRGVNGRENVIKTNYRHDSFRRQIEEYYTDEFGNLDENALGTHRITYEYDDKGNIVKQCGYNKNGNPSPVDNSGDATEKLEFDNRGNLLSAIFLDKNGNPNPTPNYMSRLYRRYDETGNQIYEERYSAESGKEQLIYLNKKEPTCEYTRWNDGSYRIDSLDSKGRTTFVGFYDANGNLEMSGNRACERYAYIDEEKKTTQIEINYDLNRKKVDVDGICKTVTVSDSIKWTKTKWRYDKNDVLVETFIHQYNKGFNRLLSQDDANSFGVRSRCGGSSWVRYYTGEIIYSPKGEFASLLGRDEFGEADYITSNSVTYYYSKTSSKGKTKYYDEDNNEMEDVDELKDNLPKLMTIEVIDSSAYALGLRDNDLILLYGDYAVDVEALDSIFVSYEQFRKDWSLHSVIEANDNRRMVVFRIEDAPNNKFGLVEISNLKGTPSELGFLTHVRYLTKKQLARIQRVVHDNMLCDNPFISSSDFGKDYKGDNYVILGYRELYRAVRNGAYPKKVTDPAILLGACVKDRNMYWNMTDGGETEPFEEMIKSRSNGALAYPTMHFYVTKDMNNVIHMTLEDQFVYANWFDANISDEAYAKLLDLNKYVQSELESIRTRPSTIKSKNLLGLWEVAKDTANTYLPEGWIYLAKDGTCQGTLTSYGTRSFSEGTAVYKVEKAIEGTWFHIDSIITFKPTNDDSIRLSCIDLLGTDDEDLKQRAVAYMNSICEEKKESLLKRMDFEYPQWSDDLFITALDKRSFSVKGADDRDITFMKMKGKPKMESQSTQVRKPKVVSKRGNNDKSSQKEQGNDNPLLFGRWETTIPDVEQSKVIMSFDEDHTMELSILAPYSQALNDSVTSHVLFSVKIGGNWTMKDDSLCIVNDPASIVMDVDIDFDGVDEDTKNQLRPVLEEQFNQYKEELSVQLLKDNSFNGTVSVDNLTYTELEINGVTLSKIAEKRSIVIGRIEGETGYLVEKGYKGLFVILEWCDWNCTMSVDDYSTEFEKQRDNEKHIVLLPVSTDEEGKDSFKEPIEINCPSTLLLGLRIQDMEISIPYYEEDILKRYSEWKK